MLKKQAIPAEIQEAVQKLIDELTLHSQLSRVEFPQFGIGGMNGV